MQDRTKLMVLANRFATLEKAHQEYQADPCWETQCALRQCAASVHRYISDEIYHSMDELDKIAERMDSCDH